MEKSNLKKALYEDMRETLIRYKEKGILSNINLPDISKMTTEITNNRTDTGIDKSSKYIRKFVKTYNNRDYICTLFDNSIIQASYKFMNNNGDAEGEEGKSQEKNQVLHKAVLAYYPNPGLGTQDFYDIQFAVNDDERDELINLSLVLEEEYKFSSNYIRMEYSSEDMDYTPFLHPCTHMHIGANNSLRVAVNRMLFFSEFIDFILHTYYQENWLRVVFNLSKEESLREREWDFREYIKNKEDFIRNNKMETRITELEEKHYLLSL
ncbi:DUF2290 domain-containing protein [Bacillus thuringiensis]|nr:DUF2290 domain-containing protein [Bacillus thuringiensis]